MLARERAATDSEFPAYTPEDIMALEGECETARIIRDTAFHVMMNHLEGSLEERIKQGEGTQIEFKSTLRVNLHTGNSDPKMEHAVLKTLAAFMNSKGGTLFIGVNDEAEVIGLDNDNFPNEDKMALHMDNIITSKLGAGVFACLKPQFGEIGGLSFLAVECAASGRPVFLKNGNTEEFYIRAGASSPALPASHMHEYIQQHFK